jgi:hypothetical protein
MSRLAWTAGPAAFSFVVVLSGCSGSKDSVPNGDAGPTAGQVTMDPGTGPGNSDAATTPADDAATNPGDDAATT